MNLLKKKKMFFIFSTTNVSISKTNQQIMFLLFVSFNAYAFDIKRIFKSLIFNICQKETLKSLENVSFTPSNLMSSKMSCQVLFEASILGFKVFHISLYAECIKKNCVYNLPLYEYI